MQNKDILVLDLETKKSFQEVGGEENKRALGVSVAGIYSFNLDQFLAFEEHEIKYLEKILRQAELIIGFNTINFDYQVLEPYLSFSLAGWPSLDILKEIEARVGHRVSLNSVAQLTLDRQKSSHGLEAIKMYNEGRISDLKKYCLDDVRLTRDIYLFGRDQGKIIFNTKSGITTINVDWQPESILATWSKNRDQLDKKIEMGDNVNQTTQEQNGQAQLF